MPETEKEHMQTTILEEKYENPFVTVEE